MSVPQEATDRLVPIHGVAGWKRFFAISAAVLVGMLILSTVGFAGPEAIHNAAHDVRHVLSFPCH